MRIIAFVIMILYILLVGMSTNQNVALKYQRPEKKSAPETSTPIEKMNLLEIHKKLSALLQERKKDRVLLLSLLSVKDSGFQSIQEIRRELKKKRTHEGE